MEQVDKIEILNKVYEKLGKVSSLPFYILTFLFIGLKFAEIDPIATWSWWLVFAPLYVPTLAILIGARLFILFLRMM